MKKITLLTFLFMTAVLVSNAQIDNGRFENWADSTIGSYNYDSLIHWNTTDLISLQNSGNTAHSASPETSDLYEGGSSIKLSSWSAFGGLIQGIPGAASNGTYNYTISPLTITPAGGVPDVVRHAALMGYYKYTPVGSDSGSIETCLYKRNGAARDTVAFGIFKFGPSLPTVYTHFTLNIIPVSAGDPDSSLIWLQSSPRFPLPSGQTGSVLMVDSLYYSGIIGVDEISPLVKSLITYPVPAVNEINIHVELVNPVSMHYEIMDASGKLIATDKMQGDTQKIDVSKIAIGNYFITLRDDTGKKLCSDRFTIVR